MCFCSHIEAGQKYVYIILKTTGCPSTKAADSSPPKKNMNANLCDCDCRLRVTWGPDPDWDLLTRVWAPTDTHDHNLSPLTSCCVEKTFYELPVSGLARSRIDQTQDMNFCKNRARSSACRGQVASGFSFHFFADFIIHPSCRCVFFLMLSRQIDKCKTDRRRKKKKIDWFTCISSNQACLFAGRKELRPK